MYQNEKYIDEKNQRNLSGVLMLKRPKKIETGSIQSKWNGEM